jgi:predicted nucleic acid-binding protein
VIQEFTHVRARHCGRAEAEGAARLYVDVLQPLVSPTEADLRRGLELFAAYESLGAFDAVLAAVVLSRPHLTAIASADRAFAGVSGLGFVDLNDGDSLAAIGLR